MIDTNRPDKPLIFDVFLMYNELDLLELRLETLYEHVDYFILTEVDETFVHTFKPMFYSENISRFAKFADKIIYNPIINSEIKEHRKTYNYSDLKLSLPHKHLGKIPSKLPETRLMEMAHRDSGIVALSKIARAGDIVFMSDVDEIMNPKVFAEIRELNLMIPTYLEMDWYVYWMTNRCTQNWYGTVVCDYKVLEKSSIDNLRIAVVKTDEMIIPGQSVCSAGWHFSYMGGYEAIKDKMQVLGWQGFRALGSRILERLGLINWKTSILAGKSILLQDREFHEVDIDSSFPKPLTKTSSIVKKFDKDKI